MSDTAPPPAPGPDAANDIRPVVGRPTSDRGVWIFAAVLAVLAVLLFGALEARRSVTPRLAAATDTDDGVGLIGAPPALAIPGGIPDAVESSVAIPAAPSVPTITPQFYPPPPVAPRVRGPRSIPGPPIAPIPNYYGSAPMNPAERAPIIAAPPVAAEPTPEPTPSNAADRLAGGRAKASRMLNPGGTVPQGTVIQAVMETALDSTRPGFARAIISRDVRGFDGTAILIPRGSRLFGEYKADLTDGQTRAFVNWQKLTRPDGVQIALESPAADPLGRAGIGGKVDTHFLRRFSGAILQSVLDVGVAVASHSASKDNTVILGLPGSTQQFSQTTQAPVRPTLNVRQGSRVSVFVARDLDFSTVQ